MTRRKIYVVAGLGLILIVAIFMNKKGQDESYPSEETEQAIEDENSVPEQEIVNRAVNAENIGDYGYDSALTLEEKLKAYEEIDRRKQIINLRMVGFDNIIKDKKCIDKVESYMKEELRKRQYYSNTWCKVIGESEHRENETICFLAKLQHFDIYYEIRYQPDSKDVTIQEYNLNLIFPDSFKSVVGFHNGEKAIREEDDLLSELDDMIREYYAQYMNETSLMESLSYTNTAAFEDVLGHAYGIYEHCCYVSLFLSANSMANTFFYTNLDAYIPKEGYYLCKVDFYQDDEICLSKWITVYLSDEGEYLIFPEDIEQQSFNKK